MAKKSARGAKTEKNATQGPARRQPLARAAANKARADAEFLRRLRRRQAAHTP